MCDENQRLMLLNLLANTNNILAKAFGHEEKHQQDFEKEMNSVNEFLIKELEK